MTVHAHPRPKAVISLTMNLLVRLYPLKVLYGRLFRPVTFGVRAIPIAPDGRLLLLRHTYVRGWYFPGGGLSSGETIEQGAIRELHEEVGLRPCGPLSLITVQTFFLQGRSDHVVLFSVPVSGEPPQIDGNEIAEARYFSPDNLPELPPVTQSELAAFQRRVQP